MAQTVSGEERYEIVFGETFSMYSREEYKEFVEPFRVRFERNSLPFEIFKGKKCLDAGCGNGRGSLFMLSNGAESVSCLDFCEKNVENTNSYLKDFGFNNFTVQQGTLEQIPFDDQAFDFVWCNGVIMHTKHPNRCLHEISRVLKVNGNAWLYIYGAGGVYWRTIQLFRKLVGHIPAEKCIEVLNLLRYETRYVAEFIDDWYATHLRCYTAVDLNNRLAELGFNSPEPLKYGMDYDTSHRLNSFDSPLERELMGDGDLRYFLTKERHAFGDNSLLLEGEYGSDYQWPASFYERLEPAFESAATLCESDLKKIIFSSHLQRELRLLLTREEAFGLDDLIDLIHQLEVSLKSIQGVV